MKSESPINPESQRRPRPGIISGRAVGWLSMLAMIETESVNNTQIRAALDCSRGTITRYLQDVEHIYGVVIEYVRCPSGIGGWYQIRSWGVLDRGRVLAHYADIRSTANPVRAW